MSIFSGTVEKGVMKFVRSRIAAAEKAHQEDCDALDVQCKLDKEEADKRKETGKEVSADKHINSIIGKII